MATRHTWMTLLAVVVGSTATTAAAQDCMTWARRNPEHSPGIRNYVSLAYDSARGVTVLFGGYFGWPDYPETALGDTWEWDGEDWTLRSEDGPESRAGHKMAYDAARQVVVLFGGSTVDGNGNWTPRSDTWEWDGTEWTLRAMDGPGPRCCHHMAYDSMRGVTVMYGGFDGDTGAHLSDTWEWDGEDWTWRDDDGVGPGPRSQGGMAYDPGRGVTVLGGGMSSSYWLDNLFDIWEWDGSSWIGHGDLMNISDGASSGPAAYDEIRHRVWLHTTAFVMVEDEGWNGADLLRVSHNVWEAPEAAWSGMAYDSGRGVCVLFGAKDGTTFVAETWEFGSDLRITEQPLAQVVAPGDSLTLAVTTTGTGPIYYAWHKDGEALVDDGRISGSTTAALTIDPVEPGDAGSYHVVVRNDCGPIDSEPATVITCIGDINGDGSIGQPDLGILLANYDSTDATYNDGDLDLDGDVDQADLGILLATYEIPCP